MQEPDKVPASEAVEETSSVLLAFSKDDPDDDWPSDAPILPVCAAIAFL